MKGVLYMTKALNPMDPQDALYAAARRFPGGIKRLAELRQTIPARLYEKLDKDNPRNAIQWGPELDDLLDQLRAARTPAWHEPMQAFCYRHGGVFVPLPDEPAHGGAEMLTDDILEMVKEQGRLAAVISEALANDHEIDSKELLRFQAVHASALATLARMGEHVREMHEQAVAAGRVR